MAQNSSRFAIFFWTLACYLSGQSCLGAGPAYYRRIENAQSVIVFVHGIFGDAKTTWTGNNNVYYPELIANDNYFKSYSIYVYQYPTSILNSPFSIDELSENMRLFFDHDGVSAYNKIIFIAHSMGGLATRAYLLKNRKAASRTQLIYFYSTPTTGSQVASLATLISQNPQLSKMKPMQSDDYLADLQRQWLAGEFNVPSFCAYETQPTYGISVVLQASASNLCNRRLDPIDADHITIVKPDSILDARYIAFKSAVDKVLEEDSDRLQREKAAATPTIVQKARDDQHEIGAAKPTIEQNVQGDCNPGANAQGSVTIEGGVTMDCSNGAEGDAGFIYDATREECLGMDKQFREFFEDAIDWKRLRPVAFPRMSNGVLQEIVRNNKILYKKKKSNFLESFQAASDIPKLLSDIDIDDVTPWYTPRIDRYLNSIKNICKWVDVDIDVKQYYSKYEKEVLDGLK